MNRAEIIITPRLVERPAIRLPGIECVGAGRAVLERDCVRSAIVIAPRAAVAGGDCNNLRHEGEIRDGHLRVASCRLRDDLARRVADSYRRCRTALDVGDDLLG